MAELKDRKIGNSLGVVLPKEAVSRLHADEGGKKMKKAGDIIARYRNTLRALSK